MNIKKFVDQLTNNEYEMLWDVYKSYDSYPVRIRAHAIILSDKGININDISNIFDVHRNTVSRWIDQWNERKLDGILTSEGQGRPRIFSEEEEEHIHHRIEEEPRSMKSVAAQVENDTGKSASLSTFRRIAQDSGMCWKRIRKIPHGEPDPDEYKAACENLSKLKELDEKGEIDLIYLDESGFSLTPKVPYAWQSIGRSNTIRIPSSRSENINILGFLNPRKNKLFSIQFSHSIKSEDVIPSIDEFCKYIDKKTVIVIDNASIHTSGAVNEKIEEWKEIGVELFFLPTYSPELNLIEILWRKIKYEWLPFSSYQWMGNLRKNLKEIIDNFGTPKYHINFA